MRKARLGIEKEEKEKALSEIHEQVSYPFS